MAERRSSAGRVGIFGGTFDPIHLGHLEIASAAASRHQLDRVIFVPARQQPIKPASPAASGDHRLAMIRLAVGEDPTFEASECELRRQGPSYTVDTIRAFREEFGPEADLFFILGSDSVRELPRWRDLEGLADMCTLAVAARPGWPCDALDTLTGRLGAERVDAIKAAALQTTACDIASTTVRERLARGGRIDELVPPAVAEYIEQNKLYTMG